MKAMRRLLAATLALACGAVAGALLGGCGSGTKTVSVAGAPPTTQTTAPSNGTTGTATAPPTKTSSGGSRAGTGTTRSAPEPAFTEHEGSGGSGSATAAAATVRARGFTASDTSQYHPNQTLRVLIGTRTGSGDGYGQQAFFFVDGRYIGTDAKEPSATLRIVSQSDTSVTLAYPLYRHNDPLCCPGGGQAKVSFQLDNGKLRPLSTIPPTNSAKGLSRY
jgi:LppP/LprE lipoprotein